MKKVLLVLLFFYLIIACNKEDKRDSLPLNNPEIDLSIPADFPALNPYFRFNKPTKYGVQLGEKLFNDKRLSGNNSISCSSCHNPAYAFTDQEMKAVGIYGRVGLRNTPQIQNMAFMRFYNWDGNLLQLEKQPLVPIITHEEMNTSIVAVMDKINTDPQYNTLFTRAFGDNTISPDRIYRSIAQYLYTLISANSKYDRVKRREGESFTATEAMGYRIFQEKCQSCHSTELFTDQSFRNIGFPVNPDTEEAGRARVTGIMDDYMRFRVPSLRNVEVTAPYGSFGQFPTLKAVLDYLDEGVLEAANLDPILKQNGNRIPLSEQEKNNLIDFLHSLTDESFKVGPK